MRILLLVGTEPNPSVGSLRNAAGIVLGFGSFVLFGHSSAGGMQSTFSFSYPNLL